MKSLLFFLIIAVSVCARAQRTPNKLNFQGTVLGYEYDPSKGIFKKNQDIEIQGSLSDVSVKILKDGKEISSFKTSSGGDFSTGLEIGENYTLVYSKPGYGKSAVTINLKNIPLETASKGLILSHIELILNDFESDKPVDNGTAFGTIYFDTGAEEFKFKETVFDEKKSLFSKKEDNTPLNLILNSIAKNKEKNKNIESVQSTVVKDPIKNNSSEIIENSVETNDVIPSITILDRTKILSFKSFQGLTKGDIQSREIEIKNAWNQLEKDKLVAVTEEEFLLIKAREELLIAAEKELDAAKTYIQEQDDKIEAQQNLLYVSIGLILMLIVIGFLLYKNMKNKQKSNLILAEKNRKINESIRYAERIQRSVLLSDAQIKSYLPNSFIYYQPLDVVSGDFYWLTEVNNKVIVAAIDCTGHGVPGAFMSLIGNTLLNQIVKEKGITAPGEILSALHASVVDSLHHSGNDELSDDGMDMALCSLDKDSLKMTFAGAMNPVFIVSANEVIELDGNLQGIGSTVRNKIKRDCAFQEQEIQLKKNDAIYLFSDGYMDQFGGPSNEKFNLGRFKELLLSVHSLNPENQKIEIEKTFKNWKGNAKQIDDILVIGTKV